MKEQFELVLPVSKQTLVLRRATLRDERIIELSYPSPAAMGEAERTNALERLGEKPWALIARTVVSVDGEPVNWEIDDVLDLTSVDAAVLANYYRNLNTINEHAVEEIRDFFTHRADGSRRSLDLSSTLDQQS
ncbi:MAG: hypothetical protein GF399_10400 [Candidatus Coatesbacteria bacterium]|nr:hypothetical protein [Candidatus Coatesbacteria bacterium]